MRSDPGLASDMTLIQCLDTEELSAVIAATET